MESRKMVLKNLLIGQQGRNRHREQTYKHGEREGEGEMYGKGNMQTYITICKIDRQWEFSVSQETQTGAPYQPRGLGQRERWEGGSKGRGYMHTYG